MYTITDVSSLAWLLVLMTPIIGLGWWITVHRRQIRGKPLVERPGEVLDVEQGPENIEADSREETLSPSANGDIPLVAIPATCLVRQDRRAIVDPVSSPLGLDRDAQSRSKLQQRIDAEAVKSFQTIPKSKVDRQSSNGYDSRK
ncbi:hypothetical protein UCRPC4_g03245 [Phaeomoniella chlamydospora]|uniref:Uncharacterized protein n=1 Tax=Phaeomoniella chlamydospora TaxID=158046 RepID=A0A0G2EIE9_PHACM|nr:hypothetical protein UCRPC4_g03245 [Phaeomoniella chlamydospora]